MSSNERFRLNDLAKEFILKIKKRENFFKPITIVVPSTKMEQWFKMYWLTNEDNVLMNINFMTLNQALLKIVDNTQTYKLLTTDTIKSLIIKYLSNPINNDKFKNEYSAYWLNDDMTVNAIKVYDIASKLAQLFNEYEQDEVVISGWQKSLYDMVIEEAKTLNQTSISHLFKEGKDLNIIDDELYLFGFSSFTKLEKSIIDKYSKAANVVLYQLIQDKGYKKEYEITTAPSMLREIESVHSKICLLIKDHNARYSDFLVVAPNISVYENAINRVFNQDKREFVSLPYVINDKKKVQTNVSNGLNTLFNIAQKKFCTRFDLFNLINNLDIKKSRNITEDDLYNWPHSIVQMNAYRNNQENDDWNYIKKRLIFSRIVGINDSDNIIKLKDESYLPFANISFDDDSIVRFVKIIDDINSWLELIKSIKYLNKRNIIKIKKELDKWFSIKDDNGFETNKYYLSVLSTINLWYNLNVSNDLEETEENIGTSSNLLPLNTFFYMLQEVSTVTDIKAKEYFTKGITFTDFDPKTILCTKYVFFLNCSSKEYPIINVKSELDLRDYDINKLDEIENAFFIQYQNALEKFYLSYVSLDLKTDEEFYKSSLIESLIKRLEVKIEEITLDETRDWNQLFTKRAYVNKEYYQGLLSSNSDNNLKEEKFNSSIDRKKITVSEIVKFLEEPLQSKAKYLFGVEDKIEEEIRNELEPLTLNRLNESILVSKIALDVLRKKSDLTNEEMQEIKDRYNLEHKLPMINQKINNGSFNNVISIVDEIKQYVNEKMGYSYDITIPKDFKPPYDIKDDNENKKIKVEWELSCNKELCIDIKGNERRYFEVKKLEEKSGKDKKYEKFLFVYVAALLDVANENNDNEFIIILDRGFTYTFKIKPSEAIEILSNIHQMMNDYKNNQFFSIKLIDEDINNLSSLTNKLYDRNNNPWEYFEDKKLFDYETQIGYKKVKSKDKSNNEDNFKEDYNKIKDKMISIIKFIILENKDEQENSNGSI